MSEQTPETETVTPAAKPAARWGRRLAIGAGALALVAGIGVAGAMSSGWGHHGWGRHGMMKDFAEYRVTRVLEEIDATPEQTDKIKGIVTTTLDQMMPADGKGQMQAMRGEIETILKAPTVDRAAIEKLRADHVARMDEKSKVLAKALADAAEVLTVDQRAKLIEEFDHKGRRQ